jgi:hypothetical protein
VKFRLLAVVIAVSAVALVPAAAGTAGSARTAAPRTTEPVDWVDIRVTITDSRIRLSRTSVERGVVGRFIIRNIGARVHDFTFGDPTSPAGHVTSGPLKRNGKKTLLAFLDYRGSFPYQSTVKADANRAGMKGKLTIY